MVELAFVIAIGAPVVIRYIALRFGHTFRITGQDGIFPERWSARLTLHRSYRLGKAQ